MHAVAFSVKRAHLRTVHHLQRCVKRFGLTPARYDMLHAIASGIARLQRDLWRIFHVSRTTVYRERKAGRPSRGVYITTEGRRLLETATLTCHRPIARLFESLYTKRRGRLARAMQVTALNNIIATLALGFGDRSRCFYESPDDRWEPLDWGHECNAARQPD